MSTMKREVENEKWKRKWKCEKEMPLTLIPDWLYPTDPPPHKSESKKWKKEIESEQRNVKCESKKNRILKENNLNRKWEWQSKLEK